MSSIEAREYKKLAKKMDEALDYVYPTSAIVFARMGFKKLRIMRIFAWSQEVWQEVARSGDTGIKDERSMMETLEAETGIELQLASMHGKSYHDVIFLDHTLWDWGKPLPPMMHVAMRQQQGLWMEPSILAGMCTAMHRKEGWGYERIARFIAEYDAIRQELGAKTKAYYRKMEEETDVTRKDVLGVRVLEGFDKYRRKENAD